LRPLENVRIVAIQAAFYFDDCNATTWKSDSVIEAVSFPGILPILNKPVVLHEIQDVLHEFPFISHRRRILPTDSLDNTSEETAVIKFFFTEAMTAERMSFSSKNLGVFLDKPLKIPISFARDNTHAATD
jgi:hypothetical protein